MHRFNFCFSTKFGGGLRCPIFFTSKLSSPNNVSKIQSQGSFSTTIWAWSMTFKKKQIFTILEKQSMVSIWKNHFKIWMSMTWFIYLIELSKIYYVISLCMKQTDVMTDPPWTNSSIRYLIQDKNEAHKRF